MTIRKMEKMAMNRKINNLKIKAPLIFKMKNKLTKILGKELSLKGSRCHWILDKTLDQNRHFIKEVLP